VRVLQRRPSNPVDVWERGRYMRVLALSDGLALVEVQNRGSIDKPDVRFTILNRDSSSAMHVGATSALRRMLGLDVDPAPLQRRAAAERTICATAIALRGMRPPRFPDLFETFARVVPFQQLSLDAGAAIVARLVAKFGENLEHGRRCFYAFPTSRAIAATRLDALRSCGLSARKAQTLRGLARAVESAFVNEEQLAVMSTSAALEKLIELPGVGPWTAGVVLLRGLGRLDVFPSGDVGAARGLRTLMRLGPHAPLDSVIERFGDYRGYLYFCALGGWLLKNGLVQPASAQKGGTRMATKR
jgi:3-methyladenine DNA glycosylase/8-oxoguanine DNA glycosylase